MFGVWRVSKPYHTRLVAEADGVTAAGQVGVEGVRGEFEEAEAEQQSSPNSHPPNSPQAPSTQPPLSS